MKKFILFGMLIFSGCASEPASNCSWYVDKFRHVTVFICDNSGYDGYIENGDKRE